MTDKKVIFITGPVGCGKSKNAAQLANFFGCAGYVDEATASKVKQFFELCDGHLMVLALPGEDGFISSLPGGTEIELHDYYDACRRAGIDTDRAPGGRITFIIAPAGCAFHHIAEICNSIGATFFTEIARSCKAEDVPRLIEPRKCHQAVFINSTREALARLYPDAQIIAYYDACRAAGVSPFHTGSGQLIAPLNHAASLAAHGSQLEPATIEKSTYGVLMQVARERAKQVGKGYDASHDDEHACDEIAAAAAWYAMPEVCREWQLYDDSFGSTIGEALLPDGWTPPAENDRRRQLIKAAAMLVAEIERLDRAEATMQKSLDSLPVESAKLTGDGHIEVKPLPVQEKLTVCGKAVDGRQCYRIAGHEGPCAAFMQHFDND